MATESVLFHLLTPICQLQESCELWRAYASSELQGGSSAAVDRDVLLCNCSGLPCECHCHRDVSWLQENTYMSVRSEKSRNIRQKIQHRHKSSGQRVSGASFKSSSEPAVTAATEPAVNDSQEALSKAAVAEWHARKSAEIRSGYKTSAQRAKEDEEKRAQAEQAKREEGKAAYESWMKKKQESGWTKKNTDKDEQEEKARADAESKAETQAAIEKWRARKEAEMSQLKRERRRRQQEEEAAKAAEEKEKREQSSRDKEAWTEKKRQQSREKARTRLQTERTEADEKLRIEAENREKARKAYEEWCGRKDDTSAGPVSDSGEMGSKKFLGPAWRPNSTARPK